MTEPRRIPVTDAFGRPREMIVHLSEQNQVVLGVPPGEFAAIDPGAVGDVIEALRDARTAALQGQRWTS
jgi:hypothetical protein